MNRTRHIWIRFLLNIKGLTYFPAETWDRLIILIKLSWLSLERGTPVYIGLAIRMIILYCKLLSTLWGFHWRFLSVIVHEISIIHGNIRQRRHQNSLYYLEQKYCWNKLLNCWPMLLRNQKKIIMNCELEDVEVAHRLGKPPEQTVVLESDQAASKTRPATRAVIVRFASRRIKSRVMKEKKNLKTNPFMRANGTPASAFLTDDLTKRQAQLVYQAA